MTSNIKKRLMQWRKENLLRMKELLNMMRYAGEDPELMSEYKWFAEDSLRLKEMIKFF